MKRISFKAAEALKEAGYPQIRGPFYDSDGDLWENPDEAYNFNHIYYAPTYFDAWNWLWKKGIRIEILDSKITTQCYATISGEKDTVLFNSPEEAIITTVNYLVEHNLIK